LQIFVSPRAFADEHQLCLGVTYPEDQVGAPGPQFAALAVANGRAEFFQGLGFVRL
jgi:hypothetical protein